MFPLACPLLTNSDYQSARFIGADVTQTKTLAAIGAQAGDLALALAATGGVSTPGGSWAGITIGVAGSILYWRCLTSADLSAVPSGAGAVIVYRGAASIVQVESGNTTSVGASMNLGSFTPSPAHAGLLAVMRSYGDGYSFLSPSAPTAWASRALQAYYWNAGDDAHKQGINFLDRLSPPNSKYKGETIFAPGPTASGTSYAYIFEMRTP